MTIKFGLVLFFLLVFVACQSTAEEPSSPHPAEQDVIDFIRSCDAAWKARDTLAVAEALTGDYVYFSSTGQVWPRERVLALLANPAYELESPRRAELQVHLYSDVAIVGSRWTATVSFNGEAIQDDQRCSQVVVKQSGEWQLASEHCTQIEPVE